MNYKLGWVLVLCALFRLEFSIFTLLGFFFFFAGRIHSDINRFAAAFHCYSRNIYADECVTDMYSIHCIWVLYEYIWDYDYIYIHICLWHNGGFASTAEVHLSNDNGKWLCEPQALYVCPLSRAVVNRKTFNYMSKCENALNKTGTITLRSPPMAHSP